MGPRTLALRGTWSGNTQASVRIGAAASSWSWAAPIAGRRRLAIAFAAAHPLREMAGSLGDRYLRLLEEAGVLGPGLDLEGEPRVCDAAPYQTDNDEPGVSRIGDADTALDPLSSSGVQAAIQSALRAGPVVNTMLAPSSDKDAASEYWKARRSAQAATHRSWSSDRYAEAYHVHATEFWRVRATPMPPRVENALPATPLPPPDQILALSAAAELVQSPSLIGAQVVRTTFLFHPNLQEAVAFVDGVPLHAVLASMSTLSTALRTDRNLANRMEKAWRFWVGFGGTASSRPDWKLRRPPAEGAETVCGSAGAAASEWLFDRPYVTGRPRGAGNVLRPAISINGRIWGLRRWLRGMD